MDRVSKLTEIKKLLDDGLLTQEEFDKFKSELLGIQSEDAKDTKEDDSTKNHSDNQVVSESTEQEKHSKDLKNEIEKDYAQELNSIQTSHSYWRYILAIAFFIGGGFYIAYKLHFKEKWAQETTEKQNLDEDSHGTRFTYLTQPVDDLESYSVTGIANEQELYAYLNEVATYWCSEWKKAQKFQNENRRFEEMLMVSRCIDAYPLGIYQGIIVLNDLPSELSSKAFDYFQRKVKELGYDSNWNSERHKSDNKDESDSYNESYYNESSENDDYYNRQQEQAEYESSQAYYNSDEYQGSEVKKKPETNIFLTPGDKIYYGDGTKKNWVEMDENERITVYMETERAYEGNAFSEGQYIVKNGKIKMSWLFTDYEISEGALVVIDDGKRTVLNRIK